MILISRSYWPGRSKGRWRKQSRSRQSHFHTPSPRFLRAYHRAGYSDMTTWSRAMPRLSHSWEKSQHKHVRGLNVNTAYQGEELLTASIFGLWETGLPEEEGQGLEKGLEVVVMIYCRFLAQLYVSKHLRQQESRWLNWNLQTKTTALLLLLLQSTTVAKVLGVKLTR